MRRSRSGGRYADDVEEADGAGDEDSDEDDPSAADPACREARASVDNRGKARPRIPEIRCSDRVMFVALMTPDSRQLPTLDLTYQRVRLERPHPQSLPSLWLHSRLQHYHRHN